MQDAIAAKRKQLAEYSIATYAPQFSHFLPAEIISGNSLPRRVRHYCNVVVFWAWLAQMVEANSSLPKAVGLIQSLCDEAGLPRPSEDTGGYSKGRGRWCDVRNHRQRNLFHSAPGEKNPERRNAAPFEAVFVA